MGIRKFAKNVYERYTPFVQLFGWVAVTIPVLWLTFSKVNEVLAYDGRIASVESVQTAYDKRVDKLDNKLEDIMEFFQVPHKRSQP